MLTKGRQHVRFTVLRRVALILGRTPLVGLHTKVRILIRIAQPGWAFLMPE